MLASLNNLFFNPKSIADGYVRWTLITKILRNSPRTHFPFNNVVRLSYMNNMVITQTGHDIDINDYRREREGYGWLRYQRIALIAMH